VHLPYLSSTFSYPLNYFYPCSLWSTSGPSTFNHKIHTLSEPTLCHPFLTRGHTNLLRCFNTGTVCSSPNLFLSIQHMLPHQIVSHQTSV